MLAPIWAAPEWYPAEMDPSVLDTTSRRAAVASYLASVAQTTDVFCLQEVQDSEFRHFLAALGPGWDGLMAENDRDWWANWVVPELGWAPNGTAVLVKRATFSRAAFADFPLGDGNHAAIVEGGLRASGRAARVASIHLDSDSNARRRTESRSLMERLPGQPGALDVVCGDVNEDTVTGSASHVFESNGFVDVLASVGNREPTHPFSSSYNASARWAIIDHVLVRGAEPLAGDVVDFGVWSIADEVERIEENMRRSGSDHFPVTAAVRP